MIEVDAGATMARRQRECDVLTKRGMLAALVAGVDGDAADDRTAAPRPLGTRRRVVDV